MSSCITSPVIDHRIFEPKTVSFPSCKWSILFQDEMCIFYIMYYVESQNDDDDSVVDVDDDDDNNTGDDDDDDDDDQWPRNEEVEYSRS